MEKTGMNETKGQKGEAEGKIKVPPASSMFLGSAEVKSDISGRFTTILYIMIQFNRVQYNTML